MSDFSILDWILENRPGEIIDIGDRIKIAHTTGEISILWKSHADPGENGLLKLGDFYRAFNGMDLFSSTFKLSSFGGGRYIGNVEVVQGLECLAKEVAAYGIVLPDKSIPFMYQAGIGYYSLCEVDGLLYEWDADTCDLSRKFLSVPEVLTQWLDDLE